MSHINNNIELNNKKENPKNINYLIYPKNIKKSKYIYYKSKYNYR